MSKKTLVIVGLVAAGCAFALFVRRQRDAPVPRKAPPGFVTTSGATFVVDGKPFRFVGANVALVYGETDLAQVRQLLDLAAADGIRVVRVWACGESDELPQAGPAGADWLQRKAFRRGPHEWNEAAFVFLDQVLVAAAQRKLFVQVCLLNWWRDTGGVTKYLDWIGIHDAQDPGYAHGINVEKALAFYTHPLARSLYREHLLKIAARRNTISGVLYADDATILGYELMNEAQAPTGRWSERRAWMAEMSAYLHSLDQHHLITAGSWGYRSAVERRAWIEEQKLPGLDYCDVHHYPRDDTDSFVDQPAKLQAFLDNRAAAALETGKPLVVGEFGVPAAGLNGAGRASWFAAVFAGAERAGAGGVFCWVYTVDEQREYALSAAARDAETRNVISAAAVRTLEHAEYALRPDLLDHTRNAVPLQFSFAKQLTDPVVQPQENGTRDSVLYRFHPDAVVRGQFEKLGVGPGFVWGQGVGYFEFVVPQRSYYKRTGTIIVRAHLQPVLPPDALNRISSTKVTVSIDGVDCGTQEVTMPGPGQARVYEWSGSSLGLRFDALRGRSFTVRFTVAADADLPYGLNISNWPDGFNAGAAWPIEVEVV